MHTTKAAIAAATFIFVCLLASWAESALAPGSTAARRQLAAKLAVQTGPRTW